MKWFEGAVAEAIAESRQKKALFVVVILHRTEEKNENSTKMGAFWEGVEEKSIQEPMVAIRLFDGSEPAKQFAQIYPVPIVPSSYIIDLKGKPLDVITMTDTMDDVVFMSRLRTATSGGGVSKPADEAGPSAGSGDSAVPTDVPVQNAQPTSSGGDLTVEQKAERARQLLDQKHKEDEERKNQEERDKELERRNMGKLMAEAQARREDKEVRELAEQRRREKQETQEQLKRLREQIKADREERQRREAGHRVEASAQPANNPPIQKPIPSSECRIQCKFPDGSTLVHQFPSSSKFEELIELVKQDGRQKGDFYLVQMYPRREFADTNATFLELGLTPSATILVISKHASRAVLPSGGSGIVAMLQFVLLAPFQMFYRLVLSFLGGNATNQTSPGGNATNQQSPSTNTTQQRSSRQEGNVRRFHNEDDDGASKDADDEARWNGNSTQQL